MTNQNSKDLREKIELCFCAKCGESGETCEDCIDIEKVADSIMSLLEAEGYGKCNPPKEYGKEFDRIACGFIPIQAINKSSSKEK